MSDKILHITNGSALTNYLKELDFKDDMLTWQEMLCEGPTIAAINSTAFFDIRRKFLKDYYDIDVNQEELEHELSKLDNIDEYSAIMLWFEYDLFCHINMLGVINLLHQKNIDKPLYLVSSGRIPGESQLRGLGELTPEQLYVHYNNRVLLTEDDKKLAIALWRTYCGKDHNIFKPYILENSSFKYLTNCLKAHLKRFPNHKNGLSTIEENILTIVKDLEIKSIHHLMGYGLNYQGYYGFGDTQIERIIEHLKPFLQIEEDRVTLNRKGHEALLGQHNFTAEVNNNMIYGGVKRLDFQYNSEENKLIKTIANVY
ncbi:MAG: DUF1835 domain-containing protein [Bacteroidota bacterium]